MPQLMRKHKFGIAAKENPCIHRPVLALITLLDGTNAAMFHVEHCGNRKWQYQLRFPASRAAELRQWGETENAAGETETAPLADPTVIVECRWRWADDVPAGVVALPEPWQDAAPHEWGESTAEFHVIVREPRDFQQDPLLHVGGRVRQMPISFELCMPRRLAAQQEQEIITVTGRAMGFGPATVLREVGEFVSRNDAFSISNAGPSQVTLLPVPPCAPASRPFTGTVAVRLGKLPPEEIEQLKAYVAAQPPDPA